MFKGRDLVRGLDIIRCMVLEARGQEGGIGSQYCMSSRIIYERKNKVRQFSTIFLHTLKRQDRIIIQYRVIQKDK